MSGGFWIFFLGFSGVIHLRRFQLYGGNELVVGKGCDLFDAGGGAGVSNVGNVFFFRLLTK